MAEGGVCCGVQVWTQVFDHVVVAALAFQVVMLGLLFLQVVMSPHCGFQLEHAVLSCVNTVLGCVSSRLFVLGRKIDTRMQQ